MAKGDWVRVSAERPCPICGKPDNCSVSRDGGAVWCGRMEPGSIGQNSGGQFLHRLSDGETDRACNGSPPWPRRLDYKPKVETKWQGARGGEEKSHQSPPRDWGSSALLAFENPPAEEKRSELAKVLGVGVGALRRLGVGWIQAYGFSVPERDASGKVIGINDRSPSGSKKRRRGSNAGLTFDPETWMESTIEPGFVFLVEGMSDTAALMSLGLSVVGRPNNTGGVDLLAVLLRAVPIDKVIVVIGEHDRKDHESLSLTVKKWHKPTCDGCSSCWPGKYGAITTAKHLAQQLGRPVAWAFPPENAKDAREWLRSQPSDERSC